MRKTVLKSTVGAALVWTLFFNLPGAWSIEKNVSSCTADGTCNRQGAEVNLPDVSKINHLVDQSNCNGILSTKEEIGLVRSIDSINADYIAGKVTKAQRGFRLKKLISDQAALSKNPNAPAYLAALVLQHSQKSADTVALSFGLGTFFGRPLTDAQKKILAKFDIPADQMDSFVKEVSKPYAGSMNALSKAGAKYQPGKGWDFSGSQLTPDQIAKDPHLKSAFALLVSPTLVSTKSKDPLAFEQQLTSPARTNAIVYGNQVFLPGASSTTQGRGLRNGPIHVVSIDDYRKTIADNLAKFESSAKVFLSASKAASTLGNEIKQKVHGSTDATNEKSKAQQDMIDAQKKLEEYGFPKGGPDSPMAQVAAVGSAVMRQDLSNIDRSIQVIDKTTHALVVSRNITAGTVAILATGGIAGAVVGGTAAVAEGGAVAGEAGSSAIELAEAGNVAAEAATGSAEGVSNMVRVASTAGRLATAFAAKAGVGMFAFPMVLGGALSGLEAENESYHSGGGFFCRLGTELGNNAAETLMMSNYGLIAPAAGLLGEGVAVLKGTADAAKIVKYVELGSAGVFTGTMLPGAAKEGIACKGAISGAQQIAGQHDNAITSTEWENVTNDCIHAGVDVGFAAIGGVGLAADAIEAPTTKELPAPPAQKLLPAQASESNYEIPGKPATATRDTASTTSAETLFPEELSRVSRGDKVVDSKGKTVTAIKVSADEQGPYVLAVKEDNSGFVKLRQKDLQGAKTSVGAGHNDLQLTQRATTALNAEDPSPGIKLTTNEEEETPTREKSKDDPIAIKNKLKSNMSKIYRKLVGEKKIEPLPENETVLIHVVENELLPEEVSSLELMAEHDPEKLEKMEEDAIIDCGKRSKVENEWDPDGNFRGILYAQNEVTCDLY
jgi:hypothetical protein